MSHYVLQNANDCKVTALFFLDLKKAFDTVKYELLIKKLNSYGIRGKALDRFKSYFSGRMQVVNINSTPSDFKYIEIGYLRDQSWDHYSILFLLIHCLILFILVVNVQSMQMIQLS